jgi:hypothetical protein
MMIFIVVCIFNCMAYSAHLLDTFHRDDCMCKPIFQQLEHRAGPQVTLRTRRVSDHHFVAGQSVFADLVSAHFVRHYIPVLRVPY